MKPPRFPESVSPRWQLRHELAVSVGGVLGASARFAIGTAASSVAPATLPLGTLLVNLVGCFLIGVLQTLFLDLLTVRRELQLFATVGLLGGLTTFSTFCLDTVRLLQAGQVTPALVYQCMSLGGGVLAALLGIASTDAVARLQRRRAQ